MILVMLQGFSQRRDIVLNYDILPIHYIYYIGNEIAVEGGVLLLSGFIDYSIDLGYSKNGAPQSLPVMLMSILLSFKIVKLLISNVKERRNLHHRSFLFSASFSSYLCNRQSDITRLTSSLK